MFFFTDGIVWTISPSYLSAASIFFTFEIRSHWIPIKREKQTEIYNLLMLLVYYYDYYLFDRRSTPLNGYARNELPYQLRTIPAAAAVFCSWGSLFFCVISKLERLSTKKTKQNVYNNEEWWELLFCGESGVVDTPPLCHPRKQNKIRPLQKNFVLFF